MWNPLLACKEHGLVWEALKLIFAETLRKTNLRIGPYNQFFFIIAYRNRNRAAIWSHDLKFQKRTARLKYHPNNWKHLSRTDRYETKNLVEASLL